MFALRVLERELGRPVVLHDDGSKAGMYDLRVGSVAAPEIAIECIGAVDAVRTETWNVGPAQGPMSCDVGGDWHVKLEPQARVKAVRAAIGGILRECASLGHLEFTPVAGFLRARSPGLYEALKALHIASIHCFRPEGTGLVHLGMTGTGGFVDQEGRAVPSWIGKFLRAPGHANVLSKLGASGAAECHVFVIVSFCGAPWAVESYLGDSGEAVPTAAPDLPTPVDAVWIAHGKKGVLWRHGEWRLFDSAASSL